MMMSKVTGKKHDMGNGLIAIEINRNTLSKEGATLQDAFQSAMKSFMRKEKQQKNKHVTQHS